MKGVCTFLLLFGLVIGSLANSKSQLKHALELVADKARLEKELQGVTVQEIRDKTKRLNDDFTDALGLAKQIAELNGILDESMILKPEFESLSAQIESIFFDVEMDVNKLPDIVDDIDDWTFLDQCVEDAYKTDFNEITDTREFLNEVFRQIYVCQVSGLQFAVDLTDFKSLPDEKVTKQLAGQTLVLLEAAVVEMAHLLKFQDNFVVGVLKDYGTSTHNELVHDLIGLEPSPSPSPSNPPNGSVVKKGRGEGKSTSPKPRGGTSPSPSDIEDKNDKRGSKKVGKNGGKKGDTEGKPISPKPPRGTSQSPNDIEEEDNEERGLLFRILNILRGTKKAGKKGGKKGDTEGKPTSPKPPRGTSPSPSDVDDEDDKRGSRKAGKKGGRKGDMEGKPASPKPRGGTSPSPSDVDDEDDKRGSRKAGKKGGRKGDMEGKPASPKPPRGTSPSPSDIEDEDDKLGSKKAGKKGGKKGDMEGKPASPKPPRGTSPSPSDIKDEDDKLGSKKAGKKGGKKGDMKGKPTSPKPPRGTSPSPSDIEDEDEEDKRGSKRAGKSLKIEIDGFLDKVKSHMKRRFGKNKG
ncbi:uncharacterized protein LOC110443837 isoform X2 [Mizuhopecten yessoensis]|uniref:uncharacterized protein LOC110443837 isoform X2 n=1 Tax=Mizuhopecten yessoensis TaxID=6573 RepID=UPI000B458E66|nr:uncharacterized protein LOC110443837 isoform X2 [Mizuhopecten yessoensis]